MLTMWAPWDSMSAGHNEAYKCVERRCEQFLPGPTPGWLSTAPGLPTTHWFQMRFVFPEPITVHAAGQVVSGRLRMTAGDNQSYTVTVEVSTPGMGVIENKHSTDVESPPPPPPPPPPPRGIENKHSTDVESCPPPSRVAMTILTQGRPCSDLGRVLVLNDPPTWSTPVRGAEAERVRGVGFEGPVLPAARAPAARVHGGAAAAVVQLR